MYTVAKSQMWVGRTPDIEMLGMRKVGFIEIGCSRSGHHSLSGFDLLSAQHCVMASSAPLSEPEKVIAQRLFDSSRYQRWIITQCLVDLWMMTKTLEIGRASCRERV